MMMMIVIIIIIINVWAGDVAYLEECLSRMCEALCSVPSSTTHTECGSMHLLAQDLDRSPSRRIWSSRSFLAKS